MTPELIRALGISAGILIAVVVLVVGISFVAVKRGETEMAAREKHRH
jgi:hypothetical protein